MRITFQRSAAGADSYSKIERDDGAVFRMAEFTRGGARLPHDLRHLVVELELGVIDGIWGTIADGGIYTSMRFTGGHRLPHDAARKSDALKKARRHRIGRAELMHAGEKRAVRNLGTRRAASTHCHAADGVRLRRSHDERD